MTFGAALALTLADMEAELSPTAMPTWKSHARKALEYWTPEREVQGIKRADIQAWVNWRKEMVSPSTVRHELSLLHRVWRTFEESSEFADEPCPIYRLKLPKKNQTKRECQPEVVEALGKYLPPEQFAPVALAQHTFLRRLELFRLQPSDVRIWVLREDGAQALYVGEAYVRTSKTGKGRKVALNFQAAEIVRQQLAVAAAHGWKYLFGPMADRFQQAVGWAKSVWHRAKKKLGLKGHFHGLRHLGAHTAWQNKAPIEAISKMLGHSSILQTERYIGVTEDTVWLAAHAAGQGLKQANAPWAIFEQAATPPTPPPPPAPPAAATPPPEPPKPVLPGRGMLGGLIGLLARPPGLSMR